MSIDMIRHDVNDLAMCDEMGVNPDEISCWGCFDGQFYPNYGVGPNSCMLMLALNGGQERDIPENFEPDIDDDGNETYACGVYYCPDDCEKAGITKNGYKTGEK